MKKSVIIFGLGSAYDNLECYIKEKYNIVAYTSNNENDRNIKKVENKYIYPKEIESYEYDYVIICSSYYEEITEQLVKEFNVNKIKIKNICNPNFQSSVSGKNMSSDEILEDIEKYIMLNKRKNFKIDDNNFFICANDKYSQAGDLNEEYFLQDIWGAQKVLKNNPIKHYDIGSRVDGFISHLLVFRNEVTLIDIRPLKEHIEGIKFIESNAISMNNISDNSIESLSSLSVIEHFGLGRYGDPIDPEGCFKAIREFQRVIKKGGRLYLAVPVSNEDKLCFNAHRIFNPKTIINEFYEMKLLEFSYISNYKIHKVNLDNLDQSIKDIKKYSAGLFEFIKE